MKGRWEGLINVGKPDEDKIYFELRRNDFVEYGDSTKWRLRLHINTWDEIVKTIDEAREDREPIAHDTPETGEIIGYRGWAVNYYITRPTTPILRSLYHHVAFMPGETMIGVPKERDNAGVFAYKTMGHAFGHVSEEWQKDRTGYCCALGAVKMWGVVYDHVSGYRAEYAKIIGIDQVLWEPPKEKKGIFSRWKHQTPQSKTTPETILAALRNYYKVGASPTTLEELLQSSNTIK